jgi:hypothetical protein
MKTAIHAAGVLNVFALTMLVCSQSWGGAAEDDFQKRATAAGVIRAEGLNSTADGGAYVFPDGNFEKAGSGFDTGIKASGAGSLHFVIPANGGASAGGSWRVNFSEARNVTIGAGQDLYVQWRQRFDSNWLNTKFAGSGGWKQAILGEGDVPGANLEVGSCSELEVVTQNTVLRGFPQMYHNCGVYQGFEENYGAFDFKLQNAMPSPFCLYHDSTGCFKYYPNEWMTFQVHLKPGPRGTAVSTLEKKSVTGFTNSTVELWVAREGKPSQLVLSWTGVVLHENTGKSYGKVWLLPYQTGKDATVTNPVSNVWYDELIISRNRIADPGVTSVSPNPPQSVKAQ